MIPRIKVALTNNFCILDISSESQAQHLNWTDELYKEDVCFKLSKKVFSQKLSSQHHQVAASLTHAPPPALSEQILASLEQLVNLFPDNLGRLRRVLALRSRWRLGPLTPGKAGACPLVVVTSRLSPALASLLLQDSWVFYYAAAAPGARQQVLL